MYKIIDGKKISEDIINEYKDKIAKNNLHLSLHTIIVGNDEASKMYVNNQKKKCEHVGIEFVLHDLDENITEDQLIDLINALNNDDSVNGIFIQVPLPKHIVEKNIINSIKPDKDVDGFNLINSGSLFSGINSMVPCTAQSVIELLKRSDISLDGKAVTVVGRSNIVGKPVSILALNENATVTICHSHTKDLEEVCKRADILIIAIGKPNFIDEKYVKDGAVVIDVGMHRINGKACGDVNFDSVAPHTSYITPVPGGVGPMTVAMLIKNIMRKYE